MEEKKKKYEKPAIVHLTPKQMPHCSAGDGVSGVCETGAGAPT